MSNSMEYDDIVMETKDGGTRYTYVKIHNTLGTLLLKKALFICDSQKKKAELHVVRGNTRAITFYKRLGFKEDKAHSTAYVLKMVME